MAWWPKRKTDNLANKKTARDIAKKHFHLKRTIETTTSTARHNNSIPGRRRRRRQQQQQQQQPQPQNPPPPGINSTRTP